MRLEPALRNQVDDELQDSGEGPEDPRLEVPLGQGVLLLPD